MPTERERPINYSAMMARQIMADRKTKTRRTIKGDIPEEARDAGVFHSPGRDYHGEWIWLDSPDLDDASFIGDPFRCPYGVPGDRLWMKENYRVSNQWDGTKPSLLPERTMTVFYESFGSSANTDKGWAFDSAYSWRDAMPWVGKLRPSIFMPRWASRADLLVTDVAVERLASISEADALAEGIEMRPDGFYHVPNCDIEFDQCTTPSEAFAALWEHINGPGSWAANPWVWVVSFERIVP